MRDDDWDDIQVRIELTAISLVREILETERGQPVSKHEAGVVAYAAMCSLQTKYSLDTDEGRATHKAKSGCLARAWNGFKGWLTAWPEYEPPSAYRPRAAAPKGPPPPKPKR